MTRDDILNKYPAAQFKPVLITEVTRMSQGNYCVAGLDLVSQKMIRPLNGDDSNWRLSSDRTIFNVGHVIDCQPSGKRNSVMPHATEDTPLIRAPRLLEQLEEEQVYELVLPTTASSVAQGIGQRLDEDKYVVENARCNSLAGIRVPRRHLRFRDSFGKLRLTITDSAGTSYDLKVTGDSLQHIFSPSDEEAEPHFGVDEANEWLEVNAPFDELVVRVGLARPWDGKENAWSPRRCYLQANGVICPQDNYHIFAGPSSA